MQERCDAIARDESGPRHPPEVRDEVAIDALEIGAIEVARCWSSVGWYNPPTSVPKSLATDALEIGSTEVARRWSVPKSLASDALEIGAIEVARCWFSEGWHITQESSHWSNTDSMLEYLQEV